MLDLLLINPSLDFGGDRQKLRSLSVEDDIPRQQSPHIGMAYLIAVAKQVGLQVKYIDMVAYGFSVDQLIEYNPKKKLL